MHSLKPPDHILIKIYSFYFHPLLNAILDLKNTLEKRAKKGCQNEAPGLRKQRQCLKRAACKHIQKRPPQKNHQIREKSAKTEGKREKTRAKGKYFRPKTDIHLEPSLDVQKSTIYENGLAKRPQKWRQKGRPKWRQKSIKKRYPKFSSLKPPEFSHCSRKDISTEPPKHTHLFQDISRFQARVEYTRTASRGTNSLASRPTGRHQQFKKKKHTMQSEPILNLSK